MTTELDKYAQQLLASWEEIFKKGQLTLWIMLALKDGPKYMADIKQFIAEATNGILSADDHSMYRALRRYYEAELVDFTQIPGNQSGLDRKTYQLTKLGEEVLDAFVSRNITEVFFKPNIKQLIGRKES